mmetsp:Transcript_19419/g.40168  ORF Transcript_19419/g.40168 Transcript_19419/m.40168 type:complete len:167 (-) Transcript_19419:232-732(-)
MKSVLVKSLLFLLALGSSHEAWAFLQRHNAASIHGLGNNIVPSFSNPIPGDRFWVQSANNDGRLQYLPKNLCIQRRSVAPVQTCGLFGLGIGEIAVVLVVVGFVLGPQNIGKIVKASSSRAQDMSEEFKKLPDEFQKGMEEGESSARARNAKRIKVVTKDEFDKES